MGALPPHGFGRSGAQMERFTGLDMGLRQLSARTFGFTGLLGDAALKGV